MNEIVAPMGCVVISVDVAIGQTVQPEQALMVVEAMKMQHTLYADELATVQNVMVKLNDVVEVGQCLIRLTSLSSELARSTQPQTDDTEPSLVTNSQEYDDALSQFKEYSLATSDEQRVSARDKRHLLGYRTARENLADLVDTNSYIEYGQLAVAAQRSRKSREELRSETSADGIITGTATINAEQLDAKNKSAAKTAVIINDYSVLAGTQGYFHHHKLDRILGIAEEHCLPVVMYTEGGGGRPGDTDVQVSMAGLNAGSFRAWAQLSGLVPRIAVNNGYCFAGNAALFGCADITIATKTSWIGMAGPAMIAGGGLGKVNAKEIGPIEVQSANGVVDIVADDEAHATKLAKQILGYFQGDLQKWQAVDQSALTAIVPQNRKAAYAIRDVLKIVADIGSFIELREQYGRAVVTGFMRLEGRPVGVIANDCHHLGGAVDAEGAEKCARFIQLCDAFNIPVASFADTPGFMVGPKSEAQAAVRRMSSLFVVAASISIPIVAIFLRRGYGLGAMAMAGGSFYAPTYTVAWPTGEFGPMGLEGAVELGFKKELAAKPAGPEREQLFQELLQKMIENGRATEAAAYLEVDAVIDPIETRATVILALENAAKTSSNGQPKRGKKRNFVNTW